jgi:hypothetical protein
MESSQSVTPWYLDKALWVMVFGVLLTPVLKKFGVALNIEEVVGLVLPIVAYVIAHKWKSGSIVVAEIAAKAQTDAAALPSNGSPAADLKAASK